MRIKLTAGFVKSAKAEPGAERSIFWDAALPAFGLMVTSAGKRSYVCQYRHSGRSRRLTIKGGLSLEDARKEARKHLGSVAKGADPLGERRAATKAETHTLKAVADIYLSRE